jgi:hypothetical protein
LNVNREFCTKILALGATILALTALVRPAAAMTFRLLDNPGACGAQVCVLAEGAIDQDSVKTFDSFVREHRIKPGAVMALNSYGGVVLYGLTLGEHIRKAGLETVVLGPSSLGKGSAAGECASACVFGFFGGVARSVDPGGRIGVHQIYFDPSARDGLSVADVQLLSSLIAQHVERMGGTMDFLVLMLRTPAQDIHWLSASEMTRLNVTNTLPAPPGYAPADEMIAE